MQRDDEAPQGFIACSRLLGIGGVLRVAEVLGEQKPRTKGMGAMPSLESGTAATC